MSWQDSAACRDSDPTLWFKPSRNEEREDERARTHRERRAKAICARCPVIRECAKFAIDNDEKYGIWGGMSADEIARLRRNARRRQSRRQAS